MATAEQIKTLIRSHFSEESERFFTAALQVAAHEARQGHSALAHEIKSLVDKARQTQKQRLLKFPPELNGLLLTEEPEAHQENLILGAERKERVRRILHEYKQRNTLKEHSLSHRRKILLSGPPGTGKTLTASVLAFELRLPLRTIQVDRLVTKFMGETAAKLRQIFDIIRENPGVYLFDEFDAIGGDRGRDNDVGEMRRVLNSFLQFIEAESSDNLIVAATNNDSLLDKALFRRFDDVIYYALPDAGERQQLMRNLLALFTNKRFPFANAAEEAKGLSHADIDHACRNAMKEAVLSGKKTVELATLKTFLSERNQAYGGR
ncbi:MAG: ATP-binding protein [Opitutales bacterium]|nr:ATP-binding protein [Opitutales bacterium]